MAWAGRAAILAGLAGGLIGIAPVGSVDEAQAAGPPLQVVGFWASDATAGLNGLYKYPRAITWFTPLWYSADAAGGLINRVDLSILKKVRAAHIPITPSVNDETGRQAFFDSPRTMLDTARNIADMVKQEHFQGVNIDFEPPQNRLSPQLTAFTVDLRDFLPKGSVITMSVVPNSGGAYDWSKLIPEVNQFVLMTYDEHDDGSYAGPVAATPWVQNLLARTLKFVPANKIDLGVAVYGYIWPKGSTVAKTVPYNAVSSAMRTHAKWDTRDQETYAVFSTITGPKIAWWESLEGMNQKIHLAQENHLAGVALWHLGYANDSVYQMLLHQIGTQP
ncbi:MAG: glycoside hydrolase [Sulfobacillus acidophilus]|uniref:Glycoside hydrolase n=1 Tax=Sulfobacillus acidophilus TaxID=53633 RepID=A0A2T2WHY9_9FIRM|nr:MAG: glycoside hydrolase [Sulfobacillus acidophilus]